jgi:hypothetical protein
VTVRQGGTQGLSPTPGLTALQAWRRWVRFYDTARHGSELCHGSDFVLSALMERRALSYCCCPIKPERDKVTRLSIQSAKFESGRVRFPSHAPWLAAQAELFSFPNGSHDDQVDSISQEMALEIPRVEWTAKHTENFGRFAEALAMDRFWGIYLGRPW